MSQVNGVNGFHEASPVDITTDYLIVGTGPAGASLACFLASHGLKGLVVSRDPSNADTPRAHIFNMAALDCLRDIGLDRECYRMGTSGDSMVHTRWSNTMAGEEYARIYSWGNDPKRKGDYELASPSDPIDLPQSQLEPILTRWATLNGFHCRWDTKFLSFVDHGGDRGVTTTLLDNLSGRNIRVHSKYLFGADGARSAIVQQLDLPLIRNPGLGFAVNVLIEADMSHLIGNRTGNLHWILQPNLEHPDYAWIGCIRMVKPWFEWMVVIFPEPGAERDLATDEQYLERIHQMIGDASVSVKILGKWTWQINETAAEKLSEGNVFCMGDAIHRHPPNHGLGSNTCIQDAYNLAWKVAYVDKGKAGKELLDTYNTERQPVGLQVVTETNASLRNHMMIWDILNKRDLPVAERVAKLNLLSSTTPEGQKLRNQMQTALQRINREEHGLGIEMNQRYKSSAIYHADQSEAPAFTTDPLEHYQPTTYPGARLPHVWLNNTIPSKRMSTLDLAGKGKFALFTGIGGEQWKSVAEEISKELGVPIVAYSIGFRQDYEDVYLDWAKVRDVNESGCILVRPDHFVAWRCRQWEDNGGSQLKAVMKTVLSLK